MGREDGDPQRTAGRGAAVAGDVRHAEVPLEQLGRMRASSSPGRAPKQSGKWDSTVTAGHD